MVCIHDAGRIFKIKLLIHLIQQYQIFVMIVWHRLVMLVDGTTQDCVSQWISVCFDLPLTIHKGMTALCSDAGVKHNA